MDIDEKIAAAKKLIAQREEIDRRFAELFGGNGDAERKRSVCSSCGQTGHNTRSCPSSNKTIAGDAAHTPGPGIKDTGTTSPPKTAVD